MFFEKDSRPLNKGDWVIFNASKRGVRPGPRAKYIRPEERGEGYHYVVDKFWVVSEVRGNEIVLRTRRGKVHVMNADDPQLHLASWWQRLLYRQRFPKPGPDEQDRPQA